MLLFALHTLSTPLTPPSLHTLPALHECMLEQTEQSNHTDGILRLLVLGSPGRRVGQDWPALRWGHLEGVESL